MDSLEPQVLQSEVKDLKVTKPPEQMPIVVEFTIEAFQPEKTETKIQLEEIEKIFDHTSMDFLFSDYSLLSSIFTRIAKRYNSSPMALTAVYLFGYIYGVRVERRRKKSRIKTAHLRRQYNV